MASTPRAPKQWCLTKTETVNSFENWKQNLQYTLSLDANFAPFLIEGAQWEKKSKASPLRGFTNDADSVPAASRRTAQQKITLLELMLGQVANYCPVVSRNSIIKNSTSMENIWQTIRLHYGFQCTGAHFLDFANLKLEQDERPEDLYQRVVAFVEDNLLKAEGSITHHGEQPSEDEELSPTMENLMVLIWLQLVNKNLPGLVKQRYGPELRSRTLASLKPEISQALDSLLDEIQTSDDAKVLRAAAPSFKGRLQPPYKSSQRPSYRSNTRRPMKVCPLCKQAGRSEYQHFLSTCTYLPDSDRKFLTRARQIIIPHEESDDEFDDDAEGQSHEAAGATSSEYVATLGPSARRVNVKQSPYLDTFFHHHHLRVTIDSGAETNMIRASVARYVGANITKSSQTALQADGKSPLSVIGETRMTLTRDNTDFLLEALVVDNLDVDILAGVPFMAHNDIAVRPAKHQVLLGNGTIFSYGVTTTSTGPHAVRRTQAYVLRAPPTTTTIWPGEFVELDIPRDIAHELPLALEPRTDSPSVPSSKVSHMWPPPEVLDNVGGKIRILNATGEPKVLRRNEHFCQVHPVFTPPADDIPKCTIAHITTPATKASTYDTQHSNTVQLDPNDILPPEVKTQFRSLLSDFDHVFDPNIKGYNGAVGQFEAVVNMGPVLPPQRKGRIPQYGRDKLVELQQKFDELESIGIFKRPEEVGVVAEYLNPSFLVKKPSGGFRLVTAFADVGRYSKPQPSLMPDVNSTLRTIGRWKYIITSDLTSAFYQIPLSHDSIKYCGVVTPFRGVRVYVRSAMGMPGSETALEELMCRALGDLLQDGVVTKLADDLYCGGNSPEELLTNWKKVLEALSACDLKLSASKTIICPKKTMILGWIWSQGTLQACPHRIATLSTCSTPTTIRGLRSFIGAYKVLARVLPNCAKLIGPLEDMTAGKQSQDKITWSDPLRVAFNNAQSALSSNRSVVLPRPEDQLWIVTDGAVKKHGLGATLYATQNGKPRLAAFFSAKLRKRQVTWIPCEIEALCIATAIKHFSPYIIQSRHKVNVLTDSKPCVQAFEKLCRGEFSHSPRVCTFLATASHYQATIRHLAGSANVPSDFASRNALECDEPQCHVCSFIARTEDSVVRIISIQDLVSGEVKLPFTSRAAWLATQSECPDLRRTKAHLTQGTRPSRKATNIRDVKRYINATTLARDGLLIVKRIEPLTPARECIVVPRQVVNGLLTALHIKLDHPSYHQLKVVVHRYFYALDMDKAIEHVTNSCHLCASLKRIPHTLIEQSTNKPPDAIGNIFAADVVKRERQLILVVRETVTSYTSSCLISNEQRHTLRDALIQLCTTIRPVAGPPMIIRTDPAPGFRSLEKDSMLHRNGITVDIGRVKNPNKNPVAEKAIQELESEILRQQPTGGPITSLTLSVATARLNSRIRSRGLSAWEMWTQRDQFTHTQLPITDQQLIIEQHQLRKSNHPHSMKAKAPKGRVAMPSPVDIGNLVYLHADGDKSRARDRYLVVAVNGDWCTVRKFTGPQLRSASYQIKRSECYMVPDDTPHVPLKHGQHYDSDTSDDDSPTPDPPSPPDVPCELALPPANDRAPVIPIECDTLQPDPQACAPVAGEEVPPRRSTRPHRVPSYLKDYEVYM